MSENPSATPNDHGPWRLEMLANSSGFPISQGRDDFGYRFGGPALNGKSISIRWEGQDLLAMKAPSLVASEMAKDLRRRWPDPLVANALGKSRGLIAAGRRSCSDRRKPRGVSEPPSHALPNGIGRVNFD